MIRSAIIGVLAATVFAAGAVPAFTADSGAVSITVIGQPPPAPCLLVSPDPIDFGALPYSKPGGASRSVSAPATPITSCSTAPQNVSVTGTDASGSSGVWQLGYAVELPFTANPCDARSDLYFMRVSGAGAGAALLSAQVTKAPELIKSTQFGFPPTTDNAVWRPGELQALPIELTMPCEGSNGPGEVKTLTVTFTGIVV